MLCSSFLASLRGKRNYWSSSKFWSMVKESEKDIFAADYDIQAATLKLVQKDVCSPGPGFLSFIAYFIAEARRLHLKYGDPAIVQTHWKKERLLPTDRQTGKCGKRKRSCIEGQQTCTALPRRISSATNTTSTTTTDPLSRMSNNLSSSANPLVESEKEPEEDSTQRLVQELERAEKEAQQLRLRLQTLRQQSGNIIGH